MNLQTEVLVVGAGLAGACAAVHLAQTREVMLIDAAEVAAGASGAGAGLANPFTGRRARPVWRMPEARDAFHDTVKLASAHHLVRDFGILRPAASQSLAEKMRETTREYRHLTSWLDAGDCGRHFPHVVAPHGALFVSDGCAVNIGAFCTALVASAQNSGADVRLGHRLIHIDEHPQGATCSIETPNGAAVIHARVVILAVGDGYPNFPHLARLNLHRVKGQTISIERVALPPRHPHVAGLGYLVNEGGQMNEGYLNEGGDAAPRFVAGSTYEHEFVDAQPTAEATSHIIEKVGGMAPAIAEGTVTEARAGIRVTVPGVRLPMVGPVSEAGRVWFFGGLGAKGLLTAPLIGRSLAEWLVSPSNIPEALVPHHMTAQPGTY